MKREFNVPERFPSSKLSSVWSNFDFTQKLLQTRSKNRATVFVSHPPQNVSSTQSSMTKLRNRSLTQDKGWGIGKPFRSARSSWPRIVWAECTGARTKVQQPRSRFSRRERGKESRCCAASWTRVQFPGSSTRAFSYWFYRNLPGSGMRGCVRAIVERAARN